MATSRQGIQPKPDSMQPRPPTANKTLVGKQNGAKGPANKDSLVNGTSHPDEVAINIGLRRFVAFGLLGMITLNTVVTLTAIYLVGFGLMKLSDQIIFTLLGQTVAQIAATFLTVIKYLFPTKA